jgi:chemotaxis protein methyltransferase CheR
MQPEQILAFFAKYIHAELGMVYSPTNYFQLQNRLEEIAKLLGLDGIEALYRQAEREISGTFKQLLLDTATNNETSFFRDPKVFQALGELVDQQIDGKLFAGNELRFWSAASSTGQEALSVSMVVNELKLKRSSDLRFKILATDVSERVLQSAKDAKYTQLEVQRGMPSAHLMKYFTKDFKDHWCPVSALSSPIEFKKFNLKDLVYPVQSFHVILCRNVLIYQSVESKIEILKRLTACLVPEGYLFLGAGESMLGLSDAFDHVTIAGAVCYRRKKVILKTA